MKTAEIFILIWLIMYHNQLPEVEAKSTDMVAPHRHRMKKRERGGEKEQK